MKRLRLKPALALLLSLPGTLALPAGAHAAQESQTTLRYEVRYLNDHAASALAWEQCPQKDACRMGALPGPNGRGAVMDVTADAATHERFVRALAERDVPRSQQFQLILLAAGNRPGAGPGGESPALSPGAQKALDDIRSFLPFKSYRIVDAALIRVAQYDVAQAQVAGLAANTYTVVLRFRAGGLDGRKLAIDSFNLEAGARDLIQTSFAMDVGETVVVGTSSVGGSDEALVVLLTAMP